VLAPETHAVAKQHHLPELSALKGVTLARAHSVVELDCLCWHGVVVIPCFQHMATL
jgi:hypothetical protein